MVLRVALRDNIKSFVSMKICNGKSCSVWYDKWHPNRPLSRIINHCVVELVGLSQKSCVADMFDDGDQSWPVELESRFDEVLNAVVPNIVLDVEDRSIWCNKEGLVTDLSVNQCIPGHAFILWMAIKGILKNNDRLAKWISIQNQLSHLFNIENESHTTSFPLVLFLKDYGRG